MGHRKAKNGTRASFGQRKTDLPDTIEIIKPTTTAVRNINLARPGTVTRTFIKSRLTLGLCVIYVGRCGGI